MMYEIILGYVNSKGEWCPIWVPSGTPTVAGDRALFESDVKLSYVEIPSLSTSRTPYPCYKITLGMDKRCNNPF